jgi:hypothetical protein
MAEAKPTSLNPSPVTKTLNAKRLGSRKPETASKKRGTEAKNKGSGTDQSGLSGDQFQP